jgi:aspartyl-tRNA(Asn)/glutamyl-tRNA(Gln) amidotransferase subunit B
MAIEDGWELVCGLEVHAELKTATKVFCSCANNFGDEPNTNVCPVCLGLPGSLPVLNREAVELGMRVGLALHCTVKPSIFHRKNYFYPDMPKDFQISQYDEPLNADGWLELPDGTRIGVERAHMEEDTGKTSHMGAGGRIADSEYSLVDYNRAGVPLLEIVSRPDIRTADQAKAYVNELRGILIATGANDGKMEEGSLRVDANVSVRRPGEPLGTRCEVKNLNSLRSLVRAMEYEANRQIHAIKAGERIVQETRHWNEESGRTTSMRSKEEAMDYRYFPEPDLVPLAPSEEWVQSIRQSLPTMPADRRRALAEACGGQLAAGADAIVTVVHEDLDGLVLDAVARGADARRAINRAANELVAAGPEQIASLRKEAFIALLRMEDAGELTATQAKVVLAELLQGGLSAADPAAIAGEKGFEAMEAGAVDQLVDALIAAHPAEFERLKVGDAKVTGFFVGKAMEASARKADGKQVTALLRQRAGLS